MYLGDHDLKRLDDDGLGDEASDGDATADRRGAGPSARDLFDLRSREMVRSVLGDSFDHWLMGDGYGVYREYMQRLPRQCRRQA